MIDKKTAICEATFDLLQSGLNINELTIQQIATKASIGKGTVYEYFKSKEDILLETIVYVIDIEINHVNRIIDESKTFEETINDICMNVLKTHQKLSSFEIAFRNDEIFNKEHIAESGINKRLYETMNKLIQKGRKENIVNDNKSNEYASFVIIGSANSFCSHTHKKPENINEYAKFAYMMIEGSLK